MRLQRLPHVQHPARRALGVHNSSRVVGVMKLQAILAAVVAPAAAHHILPECGLRGYMVLQVADARKRVAEPGVRVCKHEGVERMYL